MIAELDPTERDAPPLSQTRSRCANSTAPSRMRRSSPGGSTTSYTPPECVTASPLVGVDADDETGRWPHERHTEIQTHRTQVAETLLE